MTHGPADSARHAAHAPFVPARELARRVRGGQTSARESVERALESAAAAQESTNAFITIAAERALAAADRIDARLAAGEEVGPLAGVPLAVKDNLCTSGLRTTAGSRILERFVPPYDATVVARLEAAGAVVIGKANLDEFGMGSGSENSVFGPVRNPLDPTRVAGGSSGGSAAAVAAGAAPLALGSDTGGSARLPAAFCGVIGFKPSYGALSRYGLIAYASSLDQVGVLGRDLGDVELAFDLAAGADPLDASTYDLPAGDAAAGSGSLEGVRVGLVRELADAGFGPAARAALERAAARLEERGAELVELSVPSVMFAPNCYYVVATAEASSNLARFDGTIFGARVGAHGVASGAASGAALGGGPAGGPLSSDARGQEAAMRATRGALLGREVKRRLLFGSLALSAGYYDRYYGRALKVRQLLVNQLGEALGRVDALLLPAAADVSFLLGEAQAADFGARFEGDSFSTDLATSLANLAGLPAISVPFGTGAEGLPLGVQLMAGAGRDRALLRWARHLTEE